MIAQFFKYDTAEYYVSLFDGLSQFLKIGLIICCIFIFFSFFLVLTLFVQRFKKNKLNKHKEALKNASIDFITNYIFDETLNKKEACNTFKCLLNSNFDKKIATKQIVGFANNLKGESTKDIRALFKDLNLDTFNYQLLNSPQWVNKARALYVFSELSGKIDSSQIMTLINHQRIEVRQQCLLYILKTAKTNPLEFLDRIDRPLTLWQEIYTEDSLKYDYHGDIPDFSKYLNHKFESVILFAIRMIAQFNQFENIPKLELLIDSESKAVKKEVIRCLNHLNEDVKITQLIHDFKAEPVLLQLENLNLITNNGTYQHFLKLLTYIIKADNIVKVAYFNINMTNFGQEAESHGDIIQFALREKSKQ